MRDWPTELLSRLENGESAVIVTVAEVHGSSPRTAGTRMVVTTDDILGTVGGGKAEYRAVEIARDMLAGGEAIALRRLATEAGDEQACGGRLTLVFDRIDPSNGGWLNAGVAARKAGARPVLVNRIDTGEKLLATATERHGSLGSAALDEAALGAARRADGTTRLEDFDGVTLLVDPLFAERAIDVVLFGAGHVGSAIVAVLGAHPDIRITWIDDRPQLFPAEAPPNVRIVATEDPAGQVSEMHGGEFVVVLSHSHALDSEIVENVLERGDFRYCGLIGSATKRAQFEKRWLGRGLPAETLDHLVCPIGVTGITGRQPADIAIAVAAEILQVRDADDAEPGRSRKSA